jgi:hypothetical protein
VARTISFIKNTKAGKSTTFLLFSKLITKFSKMATGPFTLPDLPYPKDALAPHISAETLEFHWGKHHRQNLKKLKIQLILV